MHVYKNKVFVYCIMSADNGEIMKIFNLLRQQDEVMVALREYFQNFIAQEQDIIDKIKKATEIDVQDSESINRLNAELNNQLGEIRGLIENEQMLMNDTLEKILALNERLAAAVGPKSESGTTQLGGGKKYKKRATKKRNRKYKRKSNKRL